MFIIGFTTVQWHYFQLGNQLELEFRFSIVGQNILGHYILEKNERLVDSLAWHIISWDNTMEVS